MQLKRGGREGALLSTKGDGAWVGVVELMDGVCLSHGHRWWACRCDGTWGLAVLSKNEPDEIVVACNGSPMVIGKEE